MTTLKQLLTDIRHCTACATSLPIGPRPVLSAHSSSRILIVGQAPGIRVHESGIAWNDPSGNRLREWMGVEKSQFYDEKLIAIVPMGFCYPGTGKSGDFPPRSECAELWHGQLLAKLKKVELTLAIGMYAQRYLLTKERSTTLTDTVRDWMKFAPTQIPLPHPSPRNNRWLKKNLWFEKDVLPYLKGRVGQLIN